MTIDELKAKIGSMLKNFEAVTSVSVINNTGLGGVCAILETADQRFTITGKKVAVKNIAMLPEEEFDTEDFRRSLWDLRIAVGNVARLIRVYEMEVSCENLNCCEQCREPFLDGDAIAQGDGGLVHLRCIVYAEMEGDN